MNQENFFIQHRTSILIIVVAVILASGLVIWMGINNKQSGGMATSTKPSDLYPSLTDEQVQSIIKAGTATGTTNLTSSEQAKLKENESSNGPDTLTDQQRSELMNAMSSK